MSNFGKIEVVVGPVYSGKSFYIISKAYENSRVKSMTKELVKILMVRPDIDGLYRDSCIFESHVGNLFLDVREHENISLQLIQPGHENRLFILENGFDVYIIDDCHFFKETIAFAVLELAKKGKKIYVSGLNLDFVDRPFPATSALLSIPECSIVNRYNNCSICGGKGYRTVRLKDDKVVYEGGKFVILQGEQIESIRHIGVCINCKREHYNFSV